MAWSTREIAELAGTSLRAVRHYHEVGLLDEPERRSNGYKSYGVAHLVRLLRIKRLVDLGFSLSQIGEMNETDDHPQTALRTLDAELAATIERLQRARMEIGVILRNSVPTDLPLEFAPGAKRMSEADRSFTVVMSRILGPQGQQDMADMISNLDYCAVPTADFDNLPADADEATKQEIAERMAPYVIAMYEEHPRIRNFVDDAPGGRKFATTTVGKALVELYNRAQLDVLIRVEKLMLEAQGTAPAEPPEPA